MIVYLYCCHIWLLATHFTQFVNQMQKTISHDTTSTLMAIKTNSLIMLQKLILTLIYTMCPQPVIARSHELIYTNLVWILEESTV